MMKCLFASLLLAVLPCVGFGQTEDRQFETLGQYGAWETGWYVDTFTDEPTAWYASNSLSEDDRIFFMCYHSSKYYSYLAFANQEVVNAPTQTLIRVDDKPISKTLVNAPFQAFVAYEDADMVLDQMRGGEDVRFRITKSGQTYTYRLSLEGFDVASDWVLQQCEAKTE